MNKLKPYIKDIPFAILFVNGFLLAYSQFWQHDWIYWLMPQITGHGLLSVVFMLFYAYTHRFCLYSWICIISLGLLNVLNIAYFFGKFGYYQIYAGIIIITGLTFALIKWKKQYLRTF